nr:hypothetical protein [Cyclobacterium amurskyense]
MKNDLIDELIISIVPVLVGMAPGYLKKEDLNNYWNF